MAHAWPSTHAGLFLPPSTCNPRTRLPKATSSLITPGRQGSEQQVLHTQMHCRRAAWLCMSGRAAQVPCRTRSPACTRPPAQPLAAPLPEQLCRHLAQIRCQSYTCTTHRVKGPATFAGAAGVLSLHAVSPTRCGLELTGTQGMAFSHPTYTLNLK